LFHRWQSVLLTPPRLSKPIGFVLLLVGVSICIAAVRTFRRAGTSPLLGTPTTTLVTSGPYRFSRNPIYIGYTLLYLGISFWANTLWPVVLLPVVLGVMHRAVITREEAYLQGRFGDAYSSYCQQVRRWL
jgi:protein-S-isoprenylcysteine O-methyltransferase Ste14